VAGIAFALAAIARGIVPSLKGNLG